MRIATRLFILVVVLVSLVPSTKAVNIDWVTVSNPGDAPDVLTGLGAVNYIYRIAQYEITNEQYVEFLNAVDATGDNGLQLWDERMETRSVGGIVRDQAGILGQKYRPKAGRENNPVVFVSWYDSVRFANWLHNGAINGSDTESGAYTLLGGGSQPVNPSLILREPNARYFLPSEDEWYKAAYHRADGLTGDYWKYPTSADVVPYSDPPSGSQSPDLTNTANFFKDDSPANGYDDGYAVTGSATVPTISTTENYLTDTGAYSSVVSPCGTFDQAGNV